MGLDVWFREDVARILAAVAIARDGLTSDERTLFSGHLRRLWHEPGRGAHYPKGGCALDGLPEGRLSLSLWTPLAWTALPRSAVPPERQAIMQLPALAEQPAASVPPR